MVRLRREIRRCPDSSIQRGSHVTLLSRNDRNRTESFPAVAQRGRRTSDTHFAARRRCHCTGPSHQRSIRYTRRPPACNNCVANRLSVIFRSTSCLRSRGMIVQESDRTGICDPNTAYLSKTNAPMRENDVESDHPGFRESCNSSPHRPNRARRRGRHPVQCCDVPTLQGGCNA